MAGWFCLCSHKSTTIARFLDTLNRNAGAVPYACMVDFELSLAKALKDLKIEMRGCKFHFIQAIMRRLEKEPFRNLDRSRYVGSGTEESKAESLCYRMFHARDISTFEQTLSEMKAISEGFYNDFWNIWIGPDNALAKKWCKAFIPENAPPDLDLYDTNNMCEADNSVIQSLANSISGATGNPRCSLYDTISMLTGKLTQSLIDVVALEKKPAVPSQPSAMQQMTDNTL